MFSYMRSWGQPALQVWATGRTRVTDAEIGPPIVLVEIRYYDPGLLAGTVVISHTEVVYDVPLRMISPVDDAAHETYRAALAQERLLRETFLNGSHSLG